jgi:hypothetical protein
MTEATTPIVQESAISIQLVHGGYILHSPLAGGFYKTEVFTSTAKLNKAVRTAVEEFTLVSKKADEASE